MEKVSIAITFGFALLYSLLLLQNFAKNIVALFRASNINDVIGGHMMNTYLLMMTIILWTVVFFVLNY